MAIVGALTALVSLAKGFGWFAQAEWCQGVVNAHAQLQKMLGDRYIEYDQKYHLNRYDEVHKAWRTFQYALPWDKAGTASAYQNKVREWANAIVAAGEAYQKELEKEEAAKAKIAAEIKPEWIESVKKYGPWIGMGVLVFGLIATLVRR